MDILLGIDISTTGAKALAIRPDGAVLAVHNTPHPSSSPHALWSEQAPADWWAGALASIRGVVAELGGGANIRAVGLTGQMHGLVCLDAHNQVLRPAILWNDQRTAAQCEAITAKVGPDRLLALTGNRALTGFTAPKILWVREHEPATYQKIAHILLPKDYLRWQLSGDYAIDLADAAGTLLLDVRARAWSTEVLAALDIPPAWLPKVYEGTQVTGHISPAAAALTGLPAGIPIIAGGGDQAAGAVGMGCISPELIGLSLGTSGVVFAPLDHYAYEPEGRLHAFCHSAPGLWHFMGVMLSAAGSLQWYRDALAPGQDFESLLAEAASIPPGSEGLFFLPYLSGERSPHPDPLARGAFIGLTARHSQAHLTRAVLEGVAFGLRDCFQLLAPHLPPSYEIRISGGGAKSGLWQQILADVIGRPLVNVNTTEGAAFGAALLAGVGAGLAADVATICAGAVQTGETVKPGPESARYEAAYGVYRGLYPALAGVFREIAALP
jgi:xylulokinase